MNTTRGIFDNFPSQPSTGASPFAAAEESSDQQSPFSPAPQMDSPFTAAGDANGAQQMEQGKSTKLPEKRKPDSPFQIADPHEGFGFEPAQSSSPFRQAQPAPASAASPFAMAPQEAAPARPQEAPPVPAFGAWPPAASPAQQEQPQTRAFTQPSPPPAASPAPRPPDSQGDSHSDSYAIRQLELRAIFGVDREMNRDEILQRTRALPGIRQVAQVAEKDMSAIEAVKGMLNNLGFGGGALRLYAGAVPIEFIREGGVLLAVQSDGGFAPGVRETLMIVARELSRIP